MNKIVLFLLCSFIYFGVYSQSVIGAWESNGIAENGDKLKYVLTFTDGYQVLTIYNAVSGEFIHSQGGPWALENDFMIKYFEFHTSNPILVGTKENFKVIVTENTLIFPDNNKFYRIDKGEPGELQGAWLMSGRTVDGDLQVRGTSGPRKTMKILSGTRFQWIAYNTETRQFMGTGGGTYTTMNGEYTENLEFFSRDISRVGQSLKFYYNLINGNWHHTGLSSKGVPIDEIWSLREYY